MLLEQVTERQVQAGQAVGGLALVIFFAARLFPRYTQSIRLVVAAAYCAGLLGVVLYYLW
jgi:hypothetical protein